MSKKEEPDMKRLFAILIALALLLGQTAVLAEGTAEATEGIRVGDYLTFGTWEQDNNKPNGTEPIEWLVLEVQGSKALVISRYGLVHTRYSTGNGSQTWYNSNIRGMLNDDFFYGAFTEEERAAAREVQRRLQLVIDGNNDGIWDWDLSDESTESVFWSDRAEQLLGLEQGGLGGSFDVFRSMLLPEDRDEFNKALRRHLMFGEAFDLELRARAGAAADGEGELRHFRICGKAKRDESNRPVRMAGSLSDITDRNLTLDEAEERARVYYAQGHDAEVRDEETEESVMLLTHDND